VQPALPFEPPVGPDQALPEDPADEITADRFAAILLQEVLRRSVALERQPRRSPRTAA
jgi:hypothetical protein